MASAAARTNPAGAGTTGDSTPHSLHLKVRAECRADIWVNRDASPARPLRIDTHNPFNNYEYDYNGFCGLTYLERRGSWYRIPKSVVGVSGWVKLDKERAVRSVSNPVPCDSDFCPLLFLTEPSWLGDKKPNLKLSKRRVSRAHSRPFDYWHGRLVEVRGDQATIELDGSAYQIPVNDLFDSDERLISNFLPPAYD